MGVSKKSIDCNKKGHWIAFFVSLGTSIFLMIGAAVTPPPFVVDASIFKCVAFLLAFAALSQVPALVDSGKTAKLQHGNLSLTVGDDPDPDEPEEKEE